jgi:flagellar motor switch protein FliN
MAEEKDGGLNLADLSETDEAPAPAPASKKDDEDSIGSVMTEMGDLPRSAKDLEAVYDIPVQVSAVLGKTTMPVSALLKLGRGDIVVVEDRLGVTMTEIIKTERAN